MRAKRAAVCLMALAVAAVPMASADIVAYQGKADLQASAGPTTAEHHHDFHNWKKRVSYVRLVDSSSGRQLLKRASPPLNTLWVSPDGRYVVGLSSIKFANTVQLFVMSREGEVVHQQAVRCSDLRPRGYACAESTTNFVHWYDANQPQVEMHGEGGRPREVSVNGVRELWCSTVDKTTPEWTARCAQPPPRVRLPLGP